MGEAKRKKDMAREQAAEQVKRDESVKLTTATVLRLQRAYCELQTAETMAKAVTAAATGGVQAKADAYLREVDTALEYLGLRLPEGTTLAEVGVNFRDAQLILPKPKESKADQDDAADATGETKGAEERK